MGLSDRVGKLPDQPGDGMAALGARYSGGQDRVAMGRWPASHRWFSKIRRGRMSLAGALLLALVSACSGDEPAAPAPRTDDGAAWELQSYQGRPPTEHTRAVLEAARGEVPLGDFADGTSIGDYSREELIAELPNATASSEKAQHQHAGQDRVHPVLAGYVEKVREVPGLYKLDTGLYQIRGGLAFITLVRGDSGWIVIDAGLSRELTDRSWEFSRKHLPGGASVPISTVIYSHSHVDHFGGVKGLVSQEQVDSGEVTVIAPNGFMDHALAENVIVGSAMFRRAEYPFGSFLSPKPDGSEYFSFVPSETGSLSLIRPSRELPPGQGEVTILEVDGVTIEFMDIGGAEAPSATLLYLPDYRLIFNSELMFEGQHNIYTLRGAQARDALTWSKLINRVLQRWGGEAECMTGPHGPSFCDAARLEEYMQIQRDNYGFVHAQTVRLLNSGTKLQDVGGRVAELVPPELAAVWHTHGFHGTYNHNARGVANRYLGFYDGNPVNLDPLPIRGEAISLVQYMGGGDAILARARKDFGTGDYRLVATVLGKLVIAEPDNWPARHLLADSLEQLGYQAEGPQWRNAYLSGAKELRTGRVLQATGKNSVADLFAAASAEELLDALAVKVDAGKAQGSEITLMLNLIDSGEYWWLELKHGNLSYVEIGEARPADATLTLRLADFVALASGQLELTEIVKLAWVSIDGSPLALGKLLLALGSDDPNFALVDG